MEADDAADEEAKAALAEKIGALESAAAEAAADGRACAGLLAQAEADDERLRRREAELSARLEALSARRSPRRPPPRRRRPRRTRRSRRPRPSWPRPLPRAPKRRRPAAAAAEAAGDNMERRRRLRRSSAAPERGAGEGGGARRGAERVAGQVQPLGGQAREEGFQQHRHQARENLEKCQNDISTAFGGGKKKKNKKEEEEVSVVVVVGGGVGERAGRKWRC